MLAVEHIQRIQPLTVQADETIQHCGVRFYGEAAVVVPVRRNIELLGPLLVLFMESAIKVLFLQRIGQDECRSLIPETLNDGIDAVLVQMHSVEARTN